jgi:putative ABC transport system permease protein
MNFKILIITSFRVLKKHKVRSFLTMLGIMIGISSIIITFSIGRGAEEAISSAVLGMGEGTIYVMPAEFMKRGAFRSGVIQRVTISKKDVERIKNNSPEIAEISPMQMSVQQLEYKNKVAQETMVGCNANMIKINQNEIDLGTFFTDYHVKQKSNVIVLGSGLAAKLFDTEDPMGKIITVNKQPVTVIGVLDKKPHYFGPRDQNDQGYLPFTTAKKLCRGQDESDEEISMIGIRPYDGVDSEILLRKIKNILRFGHNTKRDEADPFTIFDQKSIEQVARDSAGIIKMFGLIAAAVSLLVGSIGVMNIMLVSVKERTREIGIRMAIGATQGSIRRQFLIESVTLCMFGGIIGVALGITGQILISHAAKFNVVIEFMPMLISLMVTVLIGIFFGYYPARQASTLHPVDALIEKS